MHHINFQQLFNSSESTITHYFSHFNRGYISMTPSFIVAAVIFRERRENESLNEKNLPHTPARCLFPFTVLTPTPPPPTPRFLTLSLSLALSSNMLSHFQYQNNMSRSSLSDLYFARRLCRVVCAPCLRNECHNSWDFVYKSSLSYVKKA